jgi:putative Holliday junction resolvase
MALSDPTGLLATPLAIISCCGETSDIDAITDIINQHEVNQVIVGLPRSMDGSIGKQAEKVKNFTQKLGNRVEIPIKFRDERLTTVSAKRVMHSVKTKKTRRKIMHDDAIAAALILQSYLDEEHPR